MKDFLKYASDQYYNGTPVISDAEFDILSSHFNYKTVGHTVTDGIQHYHRMYSLQNFFNLADAPLNLKDCVVSPKLDGAAVSLLYVGGNMSLALTRGDGVIGRDITEKLLTLVPNSITRSGVIQINGEVVAPKTIPNSRNYAAGALNLKDIEEFKTRDLTFVAYDAVESPAATWTSTMRCLRKEGFNTVDMFVDFTNFPTDGEVYRINDNKKFFELGHTSHHPRGAFALKEKKAGVVTRLNDVIWQVGKSGVVSPVAILEPIYIGDALVSRATLHNIEYIEGLNLEIGCEVEVIRSGEIIPRIVRKVS